MRKMPSNEAPSCEAVGCPNVEWRNSSDGWVCHGKLAECPKIKRVDVDFSSMTSEQIRVYMAERGWMSQDQLTDMGWGNKVGYSIWFVRWDWHGVKLGNKVSVHAHSSDLSRMRDLVAEAAQMALDAWETFPDKVPYQTVDNWIVPEDELLQPPEFQSSGCDD